MAANRKFLGDLLQTISERSRELLSKARTRRPSGEERAENVTELCERLLSGQGEASGMAIAAEILDAYRTLKTGERIAFFEALAHSFGPEKTRLEAACKAYANDPSDLNANEVLEAAEPRRQNLIRRLNLAPGATRDLVQMREHLLGAMTRRSDLQPVDRDFVHLFGSWFNRGFLVLRRIDWSTPAIILEKIIRYEAVHEIDSWDDLRARIDPPDRRCYAFFHPALVDEPLIFVEVALTRGIPPGIDPILSAKRERIEPERATTAVFYSISNCQHGLAGVSFGHFLIKQVVEEVGRQIPRLSTFVTLSPAPNFGEWLKRERASEASLALSEEDRALLETLDRPEWWNDEVAAENVREPLLRAAAWYYLRARTPRGAPLDSVARFHLGNGARLERLNFAADTSERALRQSHGLMVNYLYDLEHIEQNHEAYAQQHAVVAASAVTRLVKTPARDVVAVEE